MSTFTERGANSSSMNLMNSSTRFPEGDGMQKPRTGSVLSVCFSAAARFKVPASRSQTQFFAKFDFEVIFDISTFRGSSVQPHLQAAPATRRRSEEHTSELQSLA